MLELIRVFEHDRLRIGEQGLRECDFDALVRFNSAHNSKFFVVGHRSLKFLNYVGVVQVGRLTIEILPKADRAEQANPNKWRNALIDMLRASGYLNLAAVSSSHLRIHNASLFDLYMEVFMAEVQALLHQGLAKKYRQVEGNLGVLKGRLVFNRHLTENMIHRERFYTVHQCYDVDNRNNQLLKKALSIVATVARSPHLRNRSKSILVSFDDISDIPVTSDTFARLHFSRNTERYRPALNLAKLIILNYQPDVQAGHSHVLAILFDMNILFEKYVFSLLKSAQRRFGRKDVSVSAQQSRSFWHCPVGNKGIKPDIVVISRIEDVHSTTILDTKWKVPQSFGPSDSDLKQMFAYNVQFGANRSFLLYPHIRGARDTDGTFEEGVLTGGQAHRCGMWFLDLFKDNRLDRDFGDSLLSRILSASSETIVKP